MEAEAQFRDWSEKFAKIDRSCHAFLRDRNVHREDSEWWSVVMYRWDNPDRLLSGYVKDGVWGNIHILFLPEDDKFRFKSRSPAGVSAEMSDLTAK